MINVQTNSIYDEVYKLSPESLHNICLQNIVKNLSELTTFKLVEDGKETYRKEVFFIQKILIPCKIAEKLLEQISKTSNIRNETLSIFGTSSVYNLKIVKLYEVNMNEAGLELLNYSSFRLNQLELGCKAAPNCWSVAKLKASFFGSCDTLSSLKVEIFPAVSICSGTIFDFFVQFPNLKNLYYDTPIHGNGVTFTNENWEMLLTSCTKLKVLHFNINGSAKDIELDSNLFSKCDNLQSLTLQSAFKSEVALQSIDCVQHFSYLKNVRYIDFSVDSDPSDINQPFHFNDPSNVDDIDSMLIHTDVLAKYINTFLNLSLDKLNLLESLDLSGIYRLNDENVQNFIESHPNLHFLGLCMTNSKFCMSKEAVEPFSHYNYITISGCIIEDQIITSLLKYGTRPIYMREVLKGLFQVSATWKKRRPYILKTVIDIMGKFQQGFQHIQMAATACVFHLSKERENMHNEINIVLLSEIAKITTTMMLMYIGNLQMVKNCLLIISTDRILHHATFDRVTMSRICLNCMLKYHESVDRHVTRMAVGIVSILACKISSEETANLIKEKEMKLLLDIVQVRLDHPAAPDSTLTFNLSALWNLTDESPQACKLFFELDGITKYVRMLEIFSENVQIETRVLGLINNIAEVRFLHEVLVLNNELITRVRKLMSSLHVPVSYFSCGIIANLALCWDECMTSIPEDEQPVILQELQEAVNRFGILEQEIVTYRSFKPFYELLGCHEIPEIQNWAVWAIHHVSTLGASHYKELMTDECWKLLHNVNMKTSKIAVRNQIYEIYKALERSKCSEEMEIEGGIV